MNNVSKTRGPEVWTSVDCGPLAAPPPSSAQRTAHVALPSLRAVSNAAELKSVGVCAASGASRALRRQTLRRLGTSRAGRRQLRVAAALAAASALPGLATSASLAAAAAVVARHQARLVQTVARTAATDLESSVCCRAARTGGGSRARSMRASRAHACVALLAATHALLCDALPPPPPPPPLSLLNMQAQLTALAALMPPTCTGSSFLQLQRSGPEGRRSPEVVLSAAPAVPAARALASGAERLAFFTRMRWEP